MNKKRSKTESNIQLQDQYDLKMKAAGGVDCGNLDSIKSILEYQCISCSPFNAEECGKQDSKDAKMWNCIKYFPRVPFRYNERD